MSFDITQDKLDRAALVLICYEDGLYEWSSTKRTDQVVDQLKRIADNIHREEGADGGGQVPEDRR